METDPEHKRRMRRLKEPLAYCKWMTNRPLLWFGITLGSHIVIMSINFILIPTDYDIFPLVFDAFPVQIKDELTYRRQDAWQHRRDGDDVITRFTVDDVGPTWSRGYAIDRVVLYYTAAGGANIFRKEYLRQMADIESGIFLVDKYQTNFCQLNSELSCIKPTSIIRYFDGTYANISSLFYDPNFDNIAAVLYEASTNPATAVGFEYFLAKGSTLTPNSSVSHVIRTAVPLGWPLEGPQNDSEKYDLVSEFVVSEFGVLLDAARRGTSDGLEMSYVSWLLFVEHALPQALKDMILAFGSLVFILVVVWIQTASFWITGWAVFSIVSSFWITNLVYRTIINYAYFGYFHVISIFIVLGIGADDLFVFYNAWKATACDCYPSLAHRISDCYRRSAAAMFFTSVTTMAAFLVGGMSPVLPLGSFGIFTGVLVGVNYVSVIVYFPNVLVTHHLYFENRCCPCCASSSSLAEGPHGLPIKLESNEASDPDRESKANEPKRNTATKKRHVLVRFFRGPYYKFITHHVVRWIVIIGMTTLVAFFIWSATRIETSSESIKIYRETTNYGKAMSLSDEFEPSSDEFVVLYLVWGLQPTDTSRCHYTDWRCPGVRRKDEAFDLNTPPAQRSIQDFCYKLKYNLTSEEYEMLKIKMDVISGERAVDCFLDNLYRFTNLSYPLKQNNINSFMAQHADIYDIGELGDDFYRYFEIAVSYWLTNGYTMLSHGDYFTYDNLIGEALDPPHTQKVNINVSDELSVLGYYGTKLTYITIRVNLTLPKQGLAYTEGIPVMDNWETFFNNQLKQMHVDLRGGFQVTNDTWHWLIVQQELEHGAWIGIGVGVTIAFIVLVLATMNIIVGLLATLVIACVTACILGLIPLVGWKIDVMISTNLTLLVGLSVDYIVHLAEGYHLSDNSNRMERIYDMLEHVGISVVMGAVTTLGAAVFMLFAKILFFFQFGIFLFSIVGFSAIFSLMLFPALLSLIGPEKDTGSIVAPLRKLHQKRIARKNAELKCGHSDVRGLGQSDDDEHYINKVENGSLRARVGRSINDKTQITAL